VARPRVGNHLAEQPRRAGAAPAGDHLQCRPHVLAAAASDRSVAARREVLGAAADGPSRRPASARADFIVQQIGQIEHLLSR